MVRQITTFRYLSYLLAVLAVLVLAAGVALWKNGDVRFCYYLAFFVLTVAGAVAANARHKTLKMQFYLKDNWGKEERRKRDFSEIGSLFEYSAAGTGGIIDRQTWDDLDLGAVYHRLDRTLTNPGEAVLYRMIRTPVYEKEKLLERARLINFFQDNSAVRDELRMILYRLSRQEQNNITPLLWDELPPLSPLRPLFTLLALASLLSLAAPVLWGARALFIIVALFGINYWIHYKVKQSFFYHLPAISYLGALLRAAPKIASLELPEEEKYSNQLGNDARVSRRIFRHIRFLSSQATASDIDILLEYLKVLFLLEVRGFYAVLREIEKQRIHLQEIYLRVGELDAFQSAASYRESLEDYVEPGFISGGASLLAKEIRHPLLDRAVANTIEIKEQGVLITGSNMAGKTTFLKTIGVNAVLAQSIYTTLAASYVGNFFNIGASLGKADSLEEGKSLYYREAERLLGLVDAARDPTFPSLCLIDEVLSGTNYIERIAAAEAILDYLAAKGALVIVATHDLDLAERLKGAYSCYHFTDRVGREGLYFDYTLKKGLATTRNAITLLEYMGYPEEIVEAATAGANRYLQPE